MVDYCHVSSHRMLDINIGIKACHWKFLDFCPSSRIINNELTFFFCWLITFVRLDVESMALGDNGEKYGLYGCPSMA